MHFLPFLPLCKPSQKKELRQSIYMYYNNGYNAIFILKRSYTIKDMQDIKNEGYQNTAKRRAWLHPCAFMFNQIITFNLVSSITCSQFNGV